MQGEAWYKTVRCGLQQQHKLEQNSGYKRSGLMVGVARDVLRRIKWGTSEEYDSSTL